MNVSTMSCATSSAYWTGGDFMKYVDGPCSGPAMPRSRAILQQRIASITTRRSSGYPTLPASLPHSAARCRSGALHANVAPFAVEKPRHVVRGADVQVIGRQLVVKCDVRPFVFGDRPDERRTASLFRHVLELQIIGVIFRSQVRDLLLALQPAERVLQLRLLDEQIVLRVDQRRMLRALEVEG
jgi:hypothetical protein